MTELLQQVFAQIAQLSPERQDAIAARFLAELQDEQKWEARFAATTDEQLEQMPATVRQLSLAPQGSPADILAKIAALPLENISRQEFMQLPIEKRRTILAKQAERMLPHYQEDREWQELETGDLIDY